MAVSCLNESVEITWGSCENANSAHTGGTHDSPFCISHRPQVVLVRLVHGPHSEHKAFNYHSKKL